MPKTLEILASICGWADVEAAPGSERKLRRFDMLAYTGGPMRVRGWEHPIVLDLAGLRVSEKPRPILKDHSGSQIVGHSENIRVEDGALKVSGVISGAGPAAREVVISSENGFPWQASVGAQVEREEFIAAGKSTVVNGKSFQGPLFVARQLALGEVSFVALGADDNTNAKVAANRNKHTVEADMEFEKWVEAQGFKLDGLTEPQVASLKAHYEMEKAAAQASAATATVDSSASVEAEGAQAVSTVRTQCAAELQRIEAIQKLCGENHREIAAKAIAEGWNTERTELAILRASRPKLTGPSIHVSKEGVNSQVLEAACLMTAKFQAVEKLYDEQTLDTAQRRFHGGIGLQELLLEAAWANGFTGRNFRDSKELLRFAFKPDLVAGLSTIDIGGILSNVANKFLLDGFFSVERTWRNICAVRNVSDFKTVTSYRLIGSEEYQQVAPGGELKHGTLGNETYQNKADTYGLMLTADRRDIINDDLGAITTVPRKLGRGSGLKINDVFWSIFLNNAPFFSAANFNFLSGVDTALGIEGLSKAEVAFMDQVDADKKPIGVMPSILLVTTSLSAMATLLRNSLEIRDTTAGVKYPISNPHQGKFRTEVSRYLGNARYAGSSAKAFYLLADPNDLAVIEVAFLNGQESPTIETADADFSTLGIQMRGYHDFGVALQDPRGGVKSKGEV